MKITVKDGVILSNDKKSTDKAGRVLLEYADKIANANGLGTAENFVKKHEGRTFVVNKAMKIVEQIRGGDQALAPKVRLAGTARENVKYVFTPEELSAIAKEAAEKHRDFDIVEMERKSAMSSFKDRLDRISADRSKLARCYLDGYDFRDMDCYVEIDWSSNIKSFINIKTGEVLKRRALEQSDYQITMDLDPVKEPEPKKEEQKDSSK